MFKLYSLCKFIALTVKPLFSFLLHLVQSKDCCSKVKVKSKGIGRLLHPSAMGTYERSESLEIAALGNKIIYVQNKSEENTENPWKSGENHENPWKISKSSR